MEVNSMTTGAEAASAILGSLTAPPSSVPSTLTAEQQQAVEIAVGALLAQAGIVDSDNVAVHLASNPKGKWAVLRVSAVLGV